MAHRFLGAHVSASGGCFKAVENAAKQLGPFAKCFAFFIGPRLSWGTKGAQNIPDDHVTTFHALMRANPSFLVEKCVVHGSYLLNLASFDDNLRRKSVDLMVTEVLKCAQVGITMYVFHPGAATQSPLAKTKTKSKKRKKKTQAEEEEEQADQEVALGREQGILWVGQCLAQVVQRTQHVKVKLVVENSCGQGNTLGGTFQELRSILDATSQELQAIGLMDEEDRVHICLDTCHLHASGYEMGSFRGCDAMLEAFDKALGPQWREALAVVHVNDSRDVVGSKRDRHANIGRGTIGLQAFEWLVTNKRFQELPMILETPRGGETKKTKEGPPRKKRQVRKKTNKNAEDEEEKEDAKEEQEEEIAPLTAREEIEILVGLCKEEPRHVQTKN